MLFKTLAQKSGSESMEEISIAIRTLERNMMMACTLATATVLAALLLKGLAMMSNGSWMVVDIFGRSLELSKRPLIPFGSLIVSVPCLFGLLVSAWGPISGVTASSGELKAVLHNPSGLHTKTETLLAKGES